MLVTTSVVRNPSRSLPPSDPRKPVARTWDAALPPQGAYTAAPAWLPGLQLPYSAPTVLSTPAPHGNAAQQQKHIWKEVERTRYADLPDAPASMGADSWLRSTEHPPLARLERAVTSTLGLPFGMFQVGKYYGGPLIGMAAGLVGMGMAPVMAAYMTAQQMTQLTHVPRVMTATADFIPQAGSQFSGMFKSGAKAVVSLVAGRFGAHIRLDLFVDGRAPVVLHSNGGWNQGVTGPLAEMTDKGKTEAKPYAPNSMELEFRTWPYWEPDEDWRTVVSKRFDEGALLYQVMGQDPKTHEEVSLGELRLSSRFVASGFGDVHLQ